MDVVRQSFLNRINLLWADICKEHHIRQLTTPQPQPPLQLQEEHYAPPVSAKVQHAIQAAPWHSPRNAAKSPVQGDAAVPVDQTHDEPQGARRADEASSSKHYAIATVSALHPTRIAAVPSTASEVVRASVPAPSPGSPSAFPRSPVDATVPRLAAVPDPAYGQLLCGHRVNAREPDCDVCKLLDADSEALVIELANPLQICVQESLLRVEGPRLACGHPVEHLEQGCLVCQKHCAHKEAGSRLVAGGSLKGNASCLSCGHCFNDLREECNVCRKHYADKEAGSKLVAGGSRLVAGGSSPSTAPYLACPHFSDDRRKTCTTCQKHYAGKGTVASASLGSMSAPAHPATTATRYPRLVCGHPQFQEGCMVCLHRQCWGSTSEMNLQQSLTPVTEDDVMSAVDWSADQTTPAVPSRKRSSPFDAIELKRSSPFDAQEKQASSRAGAETFDVEDERHDDGAAAVSTNHWAYYSQVHLVSRPQITAAELYAEPLSQVVAAEIEKQRCSKFRGAGKFQEERQGRMCWDDRVKTQSFQREPEMTRGQSDDIGRLCKLLYVALHNVLDRCDLNREGGKQRRVKSETEFMKYHMAKRLFGYISRFTFTDQQWCQPRAVFEAVQMEFDNLCGRHGTRLQIHGFAFADEYEREFLARTITTSFLAHGLSYSRSHDLAYSKAVLRPRAR